MSKRNSLLFLSILIAVGFLFSPSNVTAHEASMVEFWYEVGDEPESLDPIVNQSITVIITHDITDEHVHYIESVNITIWAHKVPYGEDDHSGEHIEEHKDPSNPGIMVEYVDNYTSQPTYSMWEYNFYNISDKYVSLGGDPIEEDVIIRVTVTCNLGGSFWREIDLVHPYVHHDTDFTTAIAPSIVITILLSIPLVGIVIVDNIQKKKNKR